MTLPLIGRTAVVTGGTRGIGAAIARRLANDGAAVAVSYIEHDPAGVVSDVEQSGGRILAVQSDVTKVDDCRRLVDETVAAFGGLDILVNNAAITEAHRDWLEIEESDWDDMMAVNVKGCFLAFRAAYPLLRRSESGRVINISSVTFHLGAPRLLHYVSSKGAVIGFTRSLARDVGEDGITVNAVTPGAIRTEAEAEAVADPNEILSEQLAKQAVKRRGLPEDVAAAVAFMVRDDASFITGQTLNVDGGWIML